MVKQKGITLDLANDEVVNFETMRDVVLNGGTIASSTQPGQPAQPAEPFANFVWPLRIAKNVVWCLGCMRR